MNAQQLKNSILQMAVQGKLVPQDPNDEPASALLEHIRKEKETLIKEGKIKKEKKPSYIYRGEDNLPYEKIGKNEPVCIANEVPFDIPDSWEWARLKNLGITQTGNTPSKAHPEFFGNDIPFIGPGNIKNEQIDYSNPGLSHEGELVGRIAEPNAVLQVCIGGSIGKAAINQEKVAFNQQINAISPIIVKTEYLFYCLVSPYIIRFMHDFAGGTATPIINRGLWDELLIPVPPLAEQTRIICKYQSISPYVGRYGIVCSQLDVLNTGFPALLKKSILQQVVMGKLVPQDPNDEPASVLLEKIRAEKDALVKAGKLKKDKNESIIYRRDNSYFEKSNGVERCIDDEMPFDIPEQWMWCRLGEIGETNIGLTYKPSDIISSGGILVLRSSNIKDGKMDYNDCVYVSCSVPDRAMINKGDIIICARNGSRSLVGKCALVDKDGMAFGAFMAKFNSRFNPYIKLFLESPVFREQLDGVKTETINQITQNNLKSQLIPLPPLNEQKRIVCQISELFRFYEKLLNSKI